MGRKPPRRKTRARQGQIVALVLVGVMALSLVAYYAGSVGQAPRPLPAAGGPDAGERYVQEGNRAYDNGDFASAVRAYERALPWRGNDPAVLTDLGTAYFYKTPSEPLKAIEYYDRALAVAPDLPNALFNKGVVLYQGRQDPEAAIAVWEKLSAVLPAADPMLPRVRGLIAEAQAAKKQQSKSVPEPSASPTSPAGQPSSGSRLSSGFGR